MATDADYQRFHEAVNAARGVLGLRSLPEGQDAIEDAGVLDTAGLPPLAVSALRDALVEIRALLATKVIPDSTVVWRAEVGAAARGVVRAMQSPYYDREPNGPTEVGIRRLDEAVATLAAVTLLTPALLASRRELREFHRTINRVNWGGPLLPPAKPARPEVSE